MKNIPIHTFSDKQLATLFQWVNWGISPGGYEATRPHRHHYHELLFFVKGKGQHEVDFKLYPFKPNSVHFVAAGTVHAVSRQKGSDGFSLLFSSEFIDVDEFSFFSARANPFLNMRKEEFASIRPLLNLIDAEYKARQNNKSILIQTLLEALLMLIARFYENAGHAPATQSKLPVMMKKFEQMLEANYMNHWRVAAYAQLLNTSVANLSAQCRNCYSQSAQQRIHQRLLLEIKRMLAYSSKSVKEICFELNFEDPAYFIRFFKKYTGITPLQYRQSINH